MTSPLLHFAGKYQDFIGNPSEDLLRHLPATWDETIVLPGSEIGKVAGFARRRGQEWYIGVHSMARTPRRCRSICRFWAQGNGRRRCSETTPRIRRLQAIEADRHVQIHPGITDEPARRGRGLDPQEWFVMAGSSVAISLREMKNLPAAATIVLAE